MKNTGKVRISNLNVYDSKTVTKIALNRSYLDPGKVAKGTFKYTIKSDDITNGFVTNIANATGTYNYKQVKSNEATATVTLNKPSLSLTKAAYPETYSAAGQTITYTYVVTNTGNVKIASLAVTDNKTTVDLGSVTTIDPGQSIKGTAIYQISQGDISAGSITNSAVATGRYNSNSVKSNEATATVTSTNTPPTNVPEFPSIVLPVAAILGLIFISQRKRKE